MVGRGRGGGSEGEEEEEEDVNNMLVSETGDREEKEGGAMDTTTISYGWVSIGSLIWLTLYLFYIGVGERERFGTLIYIYRAFYSKRI